MRTDLMTERERIILQMLAHKGSSHREIAVAIGTSVQVIKNMLRELRRKAGAKTTLRLVVAYWQARYKAARGGEE